MFNERPRGGFRHFLARVVFATAGVVSAVPTPPADAAPPLRRDLSAPDDDDPNDDDAVDENLDDLCERSVDDPIAAIAEMSPPLLAAERIARVLRSMDPFDATSFASLTAVSGSEVARHALADALATPFHLVGDDMILDQLVIDEDAVVRDAARRALRIRSGELRASDARALSAGPHRRTVLVIDDYPGERAALCACLAELGCEPIGAASGLAAHALPWSTLVDVVLVRHDPPWTNGAPLLDALRRTGPTLPAIVMSNRTHATIDPITVLVPVEMDELAAALLRLT
jgi:CheY-like chemotaxis protein